MLTSRLWEAGCCGFVVFHQADAAVVAAAADDDDDAVQCVSTSLFLLLVWSLFVDVYVMPFWLRVGDVCVYIQVYIGMPARIQEKFIWFDRA